MVMLYSSYCVLQTVDVSTSQFFINTSLNYHVVLYLEFSAIPIIYRSIFLGGNLEDYPSISA